MARHKSAIKRNKQSIATRAHNEYLQGLAETGRPEYSHAIRWANSAPLRRFFSPEARAALRKAPPEEGARAVLAAHPDRVVHVAGDPGCLVGLDTPEQYRRHIGP